MERKDSLNPPETFAICVPTWNSLSYLQLLNKSLLRNSVFRHQLFVHDNASCDGTSEWLNEQCIPHTRSQTNEGFCGVNHALRLACEKHQHVMVFNADMYALPWWDMPIAQKLRKFAAQGVEQFTISSRLVEPTGNNPEYTIANFGTTPETLDEKALNAERFPLAPNTIQYSHPILFPADLLTSVGFFDPQYWPGWASDHDIAKACYEKGCREFVMLGNSLVYHFSSATFKQLPQKDRSLDGQDTFQRKWKTSADEFRRVLKLKSIINA